MRKIFVFTTILICSSFLLCAGFDIKGAVLKHRFLNEITFDKATLDAENRNVTVYLTADMDWLENIDEYQLEKINRYYLNVLIQLNVDFFSIYFLVRENSLEPYRSVTDFLPEVFPVPKKEEEQDFELKALVPQKKYGNIEGFLTGKTVFVSPGHGWVYNTDNGNWGTQRPIINGMREDDSNAEMMSCFLVPYLQNAGAQVFSIRETDRQEKMVIVDDADWDQYPEDGIYEESGEWLETVSGQGYGRTDFPIELYENVFENGKYRYAFTGTGSWARWTPNIPEEGYYHVYVSYRTFSDRAPDAVYTVAHAGGSTEITVDQRYHGSTWIDIGRYYFREGMSVEAGSVTLNKNDDGEEGNIIIADAVRFGGGTGILKRGTSTSGKPRWEEAAKVHAQFMGAPSAVYQPTANDRTSDVTARSRYAAWENVEGVNDSVYISWHSNAHNGTSRGLSTYIYSDHTPGWNYDTTQAAEGSVELAELVHNRILNSVKSLFDPTFDQVGNGMYSAYFGELNPAHNSEMPSCLVELAYHDNPDDALLLRNPRFRDISARAAYQAIVQYFADRDGYEPVFLPSPPRNLMTVTNDDGSVTLSWDDPETDPGNFHGHPATGFTIQTSIDGYAFDEGTDVGNVNEVLVSDVDQGKAIFFRVIAYNDGGVSFPSGTAGAIPVKTGAQLLVVDGFQRIDAYTARFNMGSAGNNRYILEYINSYNYIIQYAEVFEELGFSVDFTHKANIGFIDLDRYDAVIWYAGEQSTVDETFTVQEQTLVELYITGGGTFFVSGTEIGWDLVARGDAADTLFFNTVFNAHYVKDSSDLYTFFGAGDFQSISGFFDDGTHYYQSEWPDVLEAYDETGETFLYYDENKTMGAGVLTVTADRKVAILGFPFETILEKGTKINLMDKVLERFEVFPKDVPEDEVPDDEEPDEAIEDIDDDTESPDEKVIEPEPEIDEDYYKDVPDKDIYDETDETEYGTSEEDEKKKKRGCSLLFI